MALNWSTLPAFTGRYTAADSNYPYGSSKSETTSGAGDGTPYIKARADDIAGFQQAMLTEAGIVPSGSSDTALASQYLESLQVILNARTTTHNIASDADYTFTTTQNKYNRFVVTDTGVLLTTTRNVIVGTAQKRFLVQNNTAQSLVFKTSGGTGITVAAGGNADLYCDGTNVINATSNTTVTQAVGVRQTVQKSSVDANGLPNFIVAGTGLSVNISATAIPVEINFAGGSIQDDKYGEITADTTISGLTANTTNYLYADITSGSIVLGATTLAIIEQVGGTYSIANGQTTINTSEMTVKLGNTSTATQVWRVFLGEAVTGASTVTSVVNYALNGMYESIFDTIPIAGTSYIKNCNIGTSNVDFKIMGKCVATDLGYAVGSALELIMATPDGSNFMPLTKYVDERGNISTSRSPVSFPIPNATAGGYSTIDKTKWNWKFKIKRSW